MTQHKVGVYGAAAVAGLAVGLLAGCVIGVCATYSEPQPSRAKAKQEPSRDMDHPTEDQKLALAVHEHRMRELFRALMAGRRCPLFFDVSTHDRQGRVVRIEASLSDLGKSWVRWENGQYWAGIETISLEPVDDRALPVPVSIKAESRVFSADEARAVGRAATFVELNSKKGI